MITVHTARKIALGFSETDEKPHVDRTAFRVKGKIFSTLSEPIRDVNFKLTPFEQSICCKEAEPECIHPVPVGGEDRAFFIKVMTIAYCNIAPLNLAEKYKSY